tara:strand:+ start:6970 stop:7941 length:972 start_codon:yes stop_codon:yes gene_type:complete
MKKIYNLLILLIVIQNSSCIIEKVNEKDFHTDDIEDIDKIIMHDKSGKSIYLEKKENIWFINNKYKVWSEQINYTLSVIKDIRIKSSVPESNIEFVIKNIATSGVKVEIFKKNKKIKGYYIGGNTKDFLGTYMIMENAKSPYILHIPDRPPGILNPKYGIEGILLNENIWRKPLLINYDKEEILNIHIKDLQDSTQSFYIDLIKKEILNYQMDLQKFNKKILTYWENSFSNLQCGPYKPNLDKNDFNLIKSIYISTEQKTDTLNIYEKNQEQNNKKEFYSSVEFMYADLNNSELVIIQKNIFNKVLINLDEFLKIKVMNNNQL